jgi:MFS family permease
LRRLLLLIGAVVLVDTMFFTALTPLLPDYAERLELSKAGAGFLASAYAMGALVGAIPSGLATAWLGVKPTILLGLIGMAVTTLLFGFADSVWLLDSARFAQGVASTCSWTAGFAWLVAAAPAGRRGELIGAALGAAIAGALLGPALGGVASLVGIGTAFSSVAVLAAGLGGWAASTPAPRPGARQPLKMLFAAVRDRRVAIGLWFVALPALLFGVLGVLAPLRLDELGFGAVGIGATFLVAAGFEALLSPVLGRVSDRHGRMMPLRAGLAASALVALTLPWIPSGWVLAAGVVLAGIAYGTFWAPSLSLLSDAAEARGLDYGFGFALTNLAWAPGAAGGAAAGGALASATADAVPYVLLAGACLLTLALVSTGEAWRFRSSS